MSIPSKNPVDRNYRRVRYVRYADDFIIGVIGRIKDANLIKIEVNSFLLNELLLSTSFEKHKLVNASRNRVDFLGVKVSVPIYKESSLTSFKRIRNGRVQLIKSKSSQGVVKLKVDIKYLIRKLNSAGFCDKIGTPLPRFQLYAISHNDIITIYNSVFSGLKNYFSFSDNYSNLAFTTQYILISSCAKLLAAKLKLKTIRAVYKKFGKGLNNNGVMFI